MQFDNIVQYASENYQHNEQSLACPNCGAIRVNGQWEWPCAVPTDTIEQLCPACKMALDNMPICKLVVQGEVSREQHDDVINICKINTDVFMQRFPMSRIMCIESGENLPTIISFTCSYLPEFIAKTVHILYGKQVVVSYVSDGHVIIMHFINDTLGSSYRLK